MEAMEREKMDGDTGVAKSSPEQDEFEDEMDVLKDIDDFF